MATIQVPYGIRLPEDENLTNTNPLLRGVVGGIGAVTGAYKAQKEQARQALKSRDERAFANRLVGAGGVVPSENRFVASAGGVPVEQPSEATRFAQTQPIAVSGKESQVAQQTVRPKTYRELYATPYDALNQMPDAKFKELVDTYKVPGLGYTESEGGMIRIIPEQQNPQAPREKLSAIGLQALADYKRAMADERSAMTGEARLGIDERRENRRDTIDEARLDIDRQKLEKDLADTDFKNPTNVAKLILQYAPKKRVNQLGEYGESLGYEEIPDIERSIAVFKAMGVPVSDDVVKAFSGANKTTKQTMTQLPSAAENKGKKIKATSKDGKVTYLVSDGKVWK